MARKKEIDREKLAQLASLGANLVELAAFFDVSVKTIRRNYMNEVVRGRQGLRMKIRTAIVARAFANKKDDRLLLYLSEKMLAWDDSDIAEARGAIVYETDWGGNAPEIDHQLGGGGDEEDT